MKVWLIIETYKDEDLIWGIATLEENVNKILEKLRNEYKTTLGKVRIEEWETDKYNGYVDEEVV